MKQARDRARKGAVRLFVAGAMVAASIGESSSAVTTYTVVDTFHQLHAGLAAKGNDTVFQGSFAYDNVLDSVTWLGGTLSQSMTGNVLGGVPEDTITLNYLKATRLDGEGGMVLSVFHVDSTDVFAGGGFATGGKQQYTDGAGVPNYNAYVSFAFNLANPVAALTPTQILNVAYGDCTPGGLMGMAAVKTCMTGYEQLTNPLDPLSAHKAGGTMMGTFPTTQQIAVAVPEPETYAMLLAGLGALGLIARRRKSPNAAS